MAKYRIAAAKAVVTKTFAPDRRPEFSRAIPKRKCNPRFAFITRRFSRTSEALENCGHFYTVSFLFITALYDIRFPRTFSLIAADSLYQYYMK